MPSTGEASAMPIDLQKIITNLRAQHLGRNHRRAQTALDVPASVWLWNACQREDANRVLELGSGFSSWVLRHWQQHAIHERGSAPIVWTVDDEAKWLETTRLELVERGFDTSRLASLENAMTDVAVTQFDIVFVDLDNTSTRLRHAADFVRWTRPGGLLVLDDWHMPHYREPMTARLMELGVAVEPLPETTDEWGRYLAFGRKPQTIPHESGILSTIADPATNAD